MIVPILSGYRVIGCRHDTIREDICTGRCIIRKTRESSISRVDHPAVMDKAAVAATVIMDSPIMAGMTATRVITGRMNRDRATG